MTDGNSDDRIEFCRDAVGSVAGMHLHDEAEVGAFPHRGPQPVERPVGTVGMHVRLKLHHLEAVFLGVVLDFFGAVLRAVAGIVDEAAEEAVRIFLNELDGVGHVVPDRRLAGQIAVTVGVNGVALRGWMKALSMRRGFPFT